MVKRMKKIYSIMLMISILTLAFIASTTLIRKASAATTPAFAVNPETTEMGPGPAVSQTFTVNLELDNVDTTNAAVGVAGLEVHLTWNNSLITPTSFTNTLGSTGGVFNGTDTSDFLYTLNGLYDSKGNKVSSAPYTNATHLEIALASTGSPWWGSGTIATITFQVDQQPLPFATCPLTYDFTDLQDANVAEITHNADNGTVFITNTVANSENVNVTWDTTQSPFTVGIRTDSNLTAPTNLDFTNSSSFATSFNGAAIDFNLTTYGAYTGTCNVTIPNNLMWNTTGTNNWIVHVDGVLAPNSIPIHDTTNEYIWFNFTSGTHMVTIGAQNYVPEFTTTSLLLVLMSTMLVAAAAATTLRKRKLHL